MAIRIKRICILLVFALLACLNLGQGFAEESSGRGGFANIGLTEEELHALETEISGIEWIKDLQKKPSEEGAVKDWSFLVYLCGSDLGTSAKADIVEMAKSGFDEDSMNVVVFTGGSTFWGSESIPVKVNGLFEIHDRVVKQVNEYPISDMSLAATLRHFIDVAVKNYPAEKYALILWDHGGGPNRGIFVDTLFGYNMMSIEELKNALEYSAFKEYKLQLIGFDACLMGSVEIAETVEPYAKYMLASEESEPGAGWNYSFLGQIKADTTIDDISRNIINGYFDGIDASMKNRDLGCTMSCVDLEQMESLKSSCDELFKDATDLLSGDTYKYFAKARNKAITFGDTGLDLIDVGSFTKNLEIGNPPSQAKLLDSIDRAVVFNRSDREGVDGLSIYHPYVDGFSYYRNQNKYDNIAPGQEYSKYIEKFTDYLTGAAQVDYSELSTLGKLKGEGTVRDMTTNFSLPLTEEQADFLAQANFLVLESADDGATYALVSIIPDVKVEDNTLTAAYVHRALFITRGEGDTMSVESEALPYNVIGSKLYSVDATLVGRDEAGSEVRQPIRIEFTLGEDDELEIRQLLIMESDGAYSSRHNIVLSDYDTVEFVREKRRATPYGDTTLLGYDQWETVDSEVCVMPIDSDWSLRMLHEHLDRKKLYIAFDMTDYQMRRYTSPLVRLQEPDPEPLVLTYDNDYMDLFVPYPVLVTDGARQGVRFSFRVTNHSDVEEAIFQITNIRLNGQPCDLTMEIYGTGPNDGLLIDEEQTCTLLIPSEILADMNALTSIDFDVEILDATDNDNNMHTVPVSGLLSLDISGLK